MKLEEKMHAKEAELNKIQARTQVYGVDQLHSKLNHNIEKI